MPKDKKGVKHKGEHTPEEHKKECAEDVQKLVEELEEKETGHIDDEEMAKKELEDEEAAQEEE